MPPFQIFFRDGFKHRDGNVIWAETVLTTVV